MTFPGPFCSVFLRPPFFVPAEMSSFPGDSHRTSPKTFFEPIAVSLFLNRVKIEPLPDTPSTEAYPHAFTLKPYDPFMRLRDWMFHRPQAVER